MNITSDSLENYLQHIEPNRIDDVKRLIELGRELTHKEPQLWGSIVGFGKLHYHYPSGHQGDMPRFGFANRKKDLTLYLSFDIAQYDELKRLGKHKHGKGCLYIRQLSDVDLSVLKQLMMRSIQDVLQYDFITIID